ADVPPNDSIVVIGLCVTHVRSLFYWKILSTSCQPGATESGDPITHGGKFPRLMEGRRLKIGITSGHSTIDVRGDLFLLVTQVAAICEHRDWQRTGRGLLLQAALIAS